MAPSRPSDARVSVDRAARGHPELQGLLLFESVFATEWYEALAGDGADERSELLSAIGRDATDQAEELRRILVAWHRAGGAEAARRVEERTRVESVRLVRDLRLRAAALLAEAAERAPTADTADRLRRLAREAKGHAERLAEIE